MGGTAGVWGTRASGGSSLFVAQLQTLFQCVLDTGCPLSPVLFVIIIDGISRLFAKNLFLFASSERNFEHTLERFAVEREVVGVRVNT